MKNAKRSNEQVKPHPAKSMSVGEYIDWKLANMAGNGDFSGFGCLPVSAAAHHILDEYIAANGGLVRLSR